MGDTKRHHCGECKQMWPDRDVMMGRGREGDRRGGGVLAAGNISLQRLSVEFLSSTNQHSKATQKHTLRISMCTQRKRTCANP